MYIPVTMVKGTLDSVISCICAVIPLGATSSALCTFTNVGGSSSTSIIAVYATEQWTRQIDQIDCSFLLS